MVKKTFLTFFIALAGFFLGYYFSCGTNTPFVLSKKDFDRSCGVKVLGRHFVFHRRFDKDLRTLARELIEKRAKEVSQKKPSSIPHHFHQIWTKDEDLPDELALASKSLELHHPQFLHTIWRPKDYEPLLTAELGPEWKSLPTDIIRDIVAAVILLKQGGIVVDLESEMLSSITPLLAYGDCIVGLEPPLASPLYRHRLFVSSSLIATAPASPIIRAWLTEMCTRSLHLPPQEANSGVKKETKISGNNKSAIWITQESLSQVISRLGREEGRVLLVGPTVFCPVRPKEIKKFILKIEGQLRRSIAEKTLEALRLRTIPLFSQVARETVCVHLRGGRLSIKRRDKGLEANQKSANLTQTLKKE